MKNSLATENYYGAKPHRPYHLSVGAIVFDQDDNIVCLYYPDIDGIKDIYKLPTGTVHVGETPEETLLRECKEELGCEVDIITFLGSQVVNDIWWGELGTPAPVEKTVLFYLAKAISLEPNHQSQDYEKDRCIVAVKNIDFLIESMKKWEVKDGMRDFNHLEILLRAKKLIQSK